MFKLAGTIAILLAVISYPVTQIEAKTIKSEKKEIKTTTDGWTNSTIDLYNRMRKVGYQDQLAKDIINECKKKEVKNPRNCVIVAGFIGKAESGAGNAVTSTNNVFGITGVSFKSKKEAVQDFVKRYNSHWFRQTQPKSFYSDTPKIKPKTVFCMSEYSSGSIGFCPNGRHHSELAYSILSK